MRTSLAVRPALSETEGSERPERRFTLLHESPLIERGAQNTDHQSAPTLSGSRACPRMAGLQFPTKKEALRPGRSASSCLGGGGNSWRCRTLRRRVAFLLVDILRRLVLLGVSLPFFTRRQLAA